VVTAKSSEEALHFTLVHGTFAPGAAWTQDGSLLRKALRAGFGDNVHFHDTFRWSGWPSHLARHWAGQKFRDFMVDITERHSGRHYIIAHSHGGPVAVYALRDKTLAERIEGVITLSTPYLLGRERELSLLGGVAAILGTFAAMWICIKLSQLPLAAYFDSHGPWYIGIGAFFLGLALQVAVPVVLVGIFLGIRRLTRWFLTTLAVPDVHPERLLIVRGPSDEANALITMFHALELLLTAVWGRRGPFDSYLERNTERLFRWMKSLVARIPAPLIRMLTIWLVVGAPILLFAMLGAGLLALYEPEQFAIWKNMGWSPSPMAMPFWMGVKVVYYYVEGFVPSWIFVLAAGVLLPVLVAASLVGWIISLALSAGLLLGAAFFVAVLCTATLAITSVPELGPCAATIVVSVEPAPPGTYTIVQLQSGSGKDDGFLLHSWSYTHPLALSEIVKWVGTDKPAGEPLVRFPESQLPQDQLEGARRLSRYESGNYRSNRRT